MSGAGNIKSGSDIKSIFEALYNPQVRADELKPYQERADKAKAAVVTIASKIEALSNLEEFTNRLQQAVEPFATGNNGVFDQRVGNVLTNDTGNGSDYVEVSATSIAVKGQINIKINQIATAANMAVNKNLAGDGFEADEDLNALITAGGGGPASVTIGVSGVGGGVVTVNINPGDNISTLATNLNNEFKIRGTSWVALTSQRNDGNYALIIKNSTTGAGDFTFNFSNSYVSQKTSTTGNDANIIVDGLAKTSRLNNINIYQGVNIQLKKPNNDNKSLTIDIADSGIQILNNLDEIKTAYNELAEFLETHNDKDSVIFQSLSLNQAISTANSLLNLVPGLGTTNSSLADIGIFLNKKNRLEIDPLKLLHASTNRIEDIRALFQTSAKITKAGANSSELEYLNINTDSANLRNTLYSPITLNDDGAGHYSFNINGGANQPAVLNGQTLTFPGTQLEGLSLSYNKTSAGAQSFSIVVSQGLADRFVSQSTILAQKMYDEISQVKAEKSISENKETIASNALNKKQREIDSLIAKFDLDAIMLQQEILYLDQMIDQIINGDT